MIQNHKKKIISITRIVCCLVLIQELNLIEELGKLTSKAIDKRSSNPVTKCQLESTDIQNSLLEECKVNFFHSFFRFKFTLGKIVSVFGMIIIAV